MGRRPITQQPAALPAYHLFAQHSRAPLASSRSTGWATRAQARAATASPIRLSPQTGGDRRVPQDEGQVQVPGARVAPLVHA